MINFSAVSFVILFKVRGNSLMNEISWNTEVHKAAWHALWPIFGPQLT